jgi:hypothetical protein
MQNLDDDIRAFVSDFEDAADQIERMGRDLANLLRDMATKTQALSDERDDLWQEVQRLRER